MVSVGVLSRSSLPSRSVRDDKGGSARPVLERRDLHPRDAQRLFGRAVPCLRRYGWEISLSVLRVHSQAETGIAVLRMQMHESACPDAGQRPQIADGKYDDSQQ